MDSRYTITANFEDGALHQFECAENEDILSAALRQQVVLLCSCRKAFCGSCKALCMEGEYAFGDRVNVQVLSPKEEEDGVVVACDTFPRSDMALAFPYTSDRLGSCSSENLEAQVEIVERLSSTVYKLLLQVRDPVSHEAKRIEFQPGQYAELQLPDGEQTRAFSFANIADDSGLLEFLIRLVPGGCFSTYLQQRAVPGDVLKLRAPLGAFTFQPGDQDEGLHAFVGGSTGLAPLLSMLRGLARQDYRGECHLFFGMQDQAALYYEDELRELAASMPRLTLHLALMDPPPQWQGYTGNAVTAFEQHFAALARKPEVYICGPAAMVEATRASCERLNIPEHRVHREEFVASGG
ncbi:methane monooxygenase component C [Solimonas aquatica]|uniref:Methane monooxygenase component C n=1 Tax=Solimonas aquatica TaxID=489703 RepID=A0A1H9GPS0_9GAMM|nr:2Fe-2S iron-sulfur cluster binding domain-containing protein [Solimonas aquatica]SEQ52086.1 methane monooxygenase component C [Solimonas aquatica]